MKYMPADLQVFACSLKRLIKLASEFGVLAGVFLDEVFDQIKERP